MTNEKLSQPEAAPEESQQEEQEQEPLGAKHGAKLLFLSFRFSQGSPDLQDIIFMYLHTIKPHWKIGGRELKDEIFQAVRSPIYNFLLTGATEQDSSLYTRDTYHKKTTNKQEEITKEKWKEGADETIQRELTAMQDIFGGDRKTPEKSFLLTNLAGTIIKREHKYLAGEGRPRGEQEPIRRTAATDPFLSQLCWYGFLGHSTGTEEYDRMFQDVALHIRVNKNELYPTEEQNLATVIRVWNEHHPENQVNIQVNQ